LAAITSHSVLVELLDKARLLKTWIAVKRVSRKHAQH
jgi:hypothetical protein